MLGKFLGHMFFLYLFLYILLSSGKDTQKIFFCKILYKFFAIRQIEAVPFLFIITRLKQKTDEDNAKETSYVPKEKEYIWSKYKKTH